MLQNAANSAVGKLLIRFARARGVRTVNIVRREASFAELKALGADICLVDGPDLSSRLRSILDGAPIRLALDAIGGHATGRLAASVADGGTVCNYGAMERGQCHQSPILIWPFAALASSVFCSDEPSLSVL